jgi:hypothetical protein
MLHLAEDEDVLFPESIMAVAVLAKALAAMHREV